MKPIGFIIFIFLCFACNNKRPELSNFKDKKMPSFDLLLMDSVTHFNTSNTPEEKPFILMYFTPYCPFCRALTEEILNNSQMFSNTEIYLLTNYPFPKLKEFYRHYQLSKYPNIVVGFDYNSYFKSYYKPSNVPYIAIYTKDKILKDILIGKVNILVLKKAIDN